MELRKVLAELEIADQYHDAVALDWDTSICSLLQEPDFLHEGQIKECFEILGLRVHSDNCNYSGNRPVLAEGSEKAPDGPDFPDGRKEEVGFNRTNRW